MLEIMRENASGWIVKILFAIIIVVFVFAFGMSGFDAGPDPVLATVNDQIITRAEFEEAFQRTAENVRAANPQVTPAQLQSAQFKQMVLGELVSNRLLQAEAARLGISASDTEVAAGISRLPIFRNQSGVFDPNIYQLALRQLRMTPAQFESSFKQELVAEKIKRFVRQSGKISPEQARQMFNWASEEARVEYIRIAPSDFLEAVSVEQKEVDEFYEKNKERFMVPAQVRIQYLTFTPQALAKYETITDDEIKAYYDANSSSLKQEEEVNARHILIQVKDSDTDEAKATAKKKIEAVLKKAKAGKDFGELAKKYSEGPSKTVGGTLGWFGRGTMVPEFEEVAFATPKGEVSDIVKTQFGYHIIKVDDRKESKIRDLADVKEELSRKIAQEKASEQITDLLDQSMDRLVSGMKLDAIGDEVNLIAATSQPMTEQFLTQTFGLTPEAAKVIMNLPKDEAHKTPLAVDGGYMLVEKVENIPSSPMPLEQVESSIINALKAEKAALKAKENAEAVLNKLTGPGAATAAKQYEGRILTSEPFDRQGNIPGLGVSPDLAKTAFNAKDKAWFPTIYPLQTGIYVARLKGVTSAPDELWEKQKTAWVRQAGQNYEQEILSSFMNGLQKNAKIDIVRQDLLN